MPSNKVSIQVEAIKQYVSAGTSYFVVDGFVTEAEPREASGMVEFPLVLCAQELPRRACAELALTCAGDIVALEFSPATKVTGVRYYDSVVRIAARS